VSDEIDPNWPPPQPKQIEDVNPNWPPPQIGSGTPLPATPRTETWRSTPPYDSTQQNLPDNGNSPKKKTWWPGAIAGVIGVGVGTGIAFLVAHHGASPLNPTAQRTPAPSAEVPTNGIPSAPSTPTQSHVVPPPVLPSLPPAGTVLTPNANGYVFIETKSGKTRCVISSDEVDCEARFTNSPIIDGEHADGIKVTRSGGSQWMLGNLGRLEGKYTLDYQSYHALGWTIVADSSGTTFTNNQTHHGMFVSIDKVEVY
jgi:hypothetical protein